MTVNPIARGCVLLMAFVGVLTGVEARQGGAANAPSQSRVTKEMWEGWMKNANNWGRWGKEDQLGALNLITPERRKKALSLSTTGTMVSLGRRPPMIPKTPDQGFFLELTPRNAYGFGRDSIDIMYHGTAYTHIDALCHGSFNETFYNGFTAKEVWGPTGCTKLGIENLAAGVITRGVLVDIPYVKKVDSLPPGTAVTPEDFEAFEKMAGIKIGPGDAVFLHTSRWSWPNVPKALPGYDASTLPWLKQRDVSIVGGDGGTDAGQTPGLTTPVHKYALVAMGANVIDVADLAAAADIARKLKRWEFTVSIQPVPIPQASGFPVNPIAIF